MKGESAALELEEAKDLSPKPFKKIAKSTVHEIQLGELPLARVIELIKAG